LVDILCQCPGLLEDTDIYKRSTLDAEKRESLRRSIVTKALGLIRDFYEWRYDLEMNHPNLCYEVPVDPTSSFTVDEEGPLFPRVLRFHIQQLGNTITFSNGILIELIEICQNLIGSEFESVAPQPPDPIPGRTNAMLFPGESIVLRDIGIEICRALEYQLFPWHSHTAAFYAMFPARAAYYACVPGSRESRWLRRVMEELAEASGIEIGRNILDSLPRHDRAVVEV
jgi:hypothetical protein